jgi:hypothetical protein
MTAPILGEPQPALGVVVGVPASPTTSPWPLAFSFALWKCNGCRQEVEWIDAVLDVEDGRLYAVRHKGCTA